MKHGRKSLEYVNALKIDSIVANKAASTGIVDAVRFKLKLLLSSSWIN